MRKWKLATVALLLALLLAAPWVLRPDAPDSGQPVGSPDEPALSLVVLTPHNEQIRYEFARAFSAWHRARHGAPVRIDWRAPGGTTEIRRLMEARYARALKTGEISPDGQAHAAMPWDILFGGGAYEHDVVKRGVIVDIDGKPVSLSMSIPAGFTQQQLDDLFGENKIGAGDLYDPDQFWLGAALTAFGIGFNVDLLRERNLQPPTTWADLTDHRYSGWLAMTDPRQSGSVATTYDSILNNLGWDQGWRVLRAMSANARFFANSSLKAPLEISAGEAAAGPVLEFYGRYQAQALKNAGGEARIGYVDPPGMVFIDSDPISILRAGPNPDVARRFVEFVLSEEGQALWQFPVRGPADATAAAMGPERFELRRMPVRRLMYEKHRSRFVDQDLRPFEIVSHAPLQGWRSLIDKMMAAFAMDIHDEMVEAWDALNEYKQHGDSRVIESLEFLFYAFPAHYFADGRILPFTRENFKAIRDDWRDPKREPELRIAYTAYFRQCYERIVFITSLQDPTSVLVPLDERITTPGTPPPAPAPAGSTLPPASASAAASPKPPSPKRCTPRPPVSQ